MVGLGFFKQNKAPRVHHGALRLIGGGGGNRTPVRRFSASGFYMLSRGFGSRAPRIPPAGTKERQPQFGFARDCPEARRRGLARFSDTLTRAYGRGPEGRSVAI